MIMSQVYIAYYIPLCNTQGGSFVHSVFITSLFCKTVTAASGQVMLKGSTFDNSKLVKQRSSRPTRMDVPRCICVECALYDSHQLSCTVPGSLINIEKNTEMGVSRSAVAVAAHCMYAFQ